MVAMFFITLTAILLRFSVEALAVNYSFWQVFVVPLNIVMWVMVGLFGLITILEIIKRIRSG